jgi:hypothetical protein
MTPDFAPRQRAIFVDPEDDESSKLRNVVRREEG